MEVGEKNGPIFKVDFQINRNKNGSLAGFTLNAQKQGEAEFFCKTFLIAMEELSGDVEICENGLRLWNGLCPFQPANICLPLTEVEFEEFQKMNDTCRLFDIIQNKEKIGFSVVYN